VLHRRQYLAKLEPSASRPRARGNQENDPDRREHTPKHSGQRPPEWRHKHKQQNDGQSEHRRSYLRGDAHTGDVQVAAPLVVIIDGPSGQSS
jgi:hypothetical protein